MQQFAPIDTWVFDLDNCLYPATSRLFEQVSARITAFVQRSLGLDYDAARALQRRYFQTYGTTLRGMMDQHGTDPDHYLADVHSVDYSVIPRSDGLRPALEALPGRRLIFTAGSQAHAAAVLQRMGLEGLFEAVFDIADAEYFPKPQQRPYELFFDRHAISGPRAVFFEDTARNLEPAKQRGMLTVHVETDSDWAAAPADAAYIDFRTRDLASFLRAAAAAGGGMPA